MTVATEPQTVESLALLYAADLIHGGLLEAGNAVKQSEAARMAGRPDIDLKLTRVVLGSHPDRFSMSDRKYTVWARYAPPTRTMSRSIEETIKARGGPLSVSVIAREVGAIYNRPAEAMARTVEAVLRAAPWAFLSTQNCWGLTAWLLDTSSWLLDGHSGSADDVQFYNALTDFDIAPWLESAAALGEGTLDSVVAFLDAVGAPILDRVLQYLVWQASPDTFDALGLFNALLADGRCVRLSTGEWVGPRLLVEMVATFPAIAERKIVDQPDPSAAELAQPIALTPEDVETLVASVLANSGMSRGARLLEDQFDVGEGEATFEADLASVIAALSADERVVWIGADRFLPAGLVPAYVHSVPDSLRFNDRVYLDAEGLELDLLLSDDGFNGGLATEIMHWLAQDVLDEEPTGEPDPTPPVTVRCVLRLHHKEIGTLPLNQVPCGFFPSEPRILNVEIALPNGQRADAWINNDTRLLYGLFDWYNTLNVDSGAVFFIERHAPDRYSITGGEETEPGIFISRNRVLELQELGDRADREEMATYEVLRAIMEHYRKGLEFLTAFTELNVARRTPRRMVASLLSGYHCFFQRNKAWVYDAKKEQQGFDKSKRKYLKK